MPSRNTTRRSDRGGAAAPLIALAAVAALLAWSASSRPMGNDEGIWAYAARAWVDHAMPPWDGTLENKPPGPFLVFGLSHALFGVSVVLPRALGIAAMLVACEAARRLAARWGGGTAGIAALLATGGAFAWNGLDGPYAAAVESFQAGLSAVAFLVAVSIVPGPGARRRAFLAGIAAGAALLFKQTTLAGGAACVVAIVLQLHAEPWPVRARAALAFCVGAAVSHAAGVGVVVASGGSLGGYVECAWGLLLDPASRDAGAPGSTWIVRLVTASCRPLVVLAFAPAILFVFRRRLRDLGAPTAALLAWCGLEIAAALAAGTFWGHQFKPAVVPCAAALGLAVGLAGSVRVRAVLAAATALAFFPQDVLFDRNAGLSRRRGAGDTDAARAIAAVVPAGERVTFASRSANPVLAQCGRLASSRRANLLFTATPAAQAEFLAGAAAPGARRIFVPVRDLAAPPQWLADELARGWVRRADVSGFALYEPR